MASVQFSSPVAIEAFTPASLSAIASGAAAANCVLGSEIDNFSAGNRFLYGDLLVNFSAAIVATGFGPFLDCFLLASPDGVTYPTSTGAAVAEIVSPIYSVGPVPAAANGLTKKAFLFRGIVLPPTKFRLMMNNQLGAAFPTSTTSTATLYRYGEEAS